MAIMLNFHPKYKEEVVKGNQTTTVRLGDRSSKYRLGEKVILSIGEKWCLTKIGEGIIESAYVKSFGELTPEDLLGASSDSHTLEGLRECLNAYYRQKIEDEDMVTVVKFKRIEGEELPG